MSRSVLTCQRPGCRQPLAHHRTDGAIDVLAGVAVRGRYPGRLRLTCPACGAVREVDLTRAPEWRHQPAEVAPVV